LRNCEQICAICSNYRANLVHFAHTVQAERIILEHKKESDPLSGQLAITAPDIRDQDPGQQVGCVALP
jgi:hypothetical protein